MKGEEMRIASFEVREWIDPKKDRRPMEEEWVLVTLRSGGSLIVSIGKYLPDLKEWYGEDEEDVVAWMPLPDPAEGIE